jgi:hypothetical protein
MKKRVSLIFNTVWQGVPCLQPRGGIATVQGYLFVVYYRCAKAPCSAVGHRRRTGLVPQGETARGMPAQAAHWVPDNKV